MVHVCTRDLWKRLRFLSNPFARSIRGLVQQFINHSHPRNLNLLRKRSTSWPLQINPLIRQLLVRSRFSAFMVHRNRLRKSTTHGSLTAPFSTAKNSRSAYDTIMTLVVGQEGSAKEYQVYRGLLCYHSKYLSRMLNGGFKEAGSEKLELADVYRKTSDTIPGSRASRHFSLVTTVTPKCPILPAFIVP